MPNQRRHKDTCYIVEATLPHNGETKTFHDIPNLEVLSNTINVNFFNGFPVVSRAMINNWLYYPDRPRRMFGDYFKINRVKL